MILGTFWLLDSLKVLLSCFCDGDKMLIYTHRERGQDSVFATTVGLRYQPWAKFLSVICTLFVVCLYDYLVNFVSKPKARMPRIFVCILAVTVRRPFPPAPYPAAFLYILLSVRDDIPPYWRCAVIEHYCVA